MQLAAAHTTHSEIDRCVGDVGVSTLASGRPGCHQPRAGHSCCAPDWRLSSIENSVSLWEAAIGIARSRRSASRCCSMPGRLSGAVGHNGPMRAQPMEPTLNRGASRRVRGRCSELSWPHSNTSVPRGKPSRLRSSLWRCVSLAETLDVDTRGWNDHRERTKTQVIAVLDDAIQRCQDTPCSLN